MALIRQEFIIILKISVYLEEEKTKPINRDSERFQQY